jgi:hypothetical protein
VNAVPANELINSWLALIFIAVSFLSRCLAGTKRLARMTAGVSNVDSNRDNNNSNRNSDNSNLSNGTSNRSNGGITSRCSPMLSGHFASFSTAAAIMSRSYGSNDRRASMNGAGTVVAGGGFSESSASRVSPTMNGTAAGGGFGGGFSGSSASRVSPTMNGTASAVAAADGGSDDGHVSDADNESDSGQGVRRSSEIVVRRSDDDNDR